MSKRRTSRPKSHPASGQKSAAAGAPRAGLGAGRIVLAALVVVAVVVAGLVLLPRVRTPRSAPHTGPLPARLAGEDPSRWSAEKAEFAGITEGKDGFQRRLFRPVRFADARTARC